MIFVGRIRHACMYAECIHSRKRKKLRRSIVTYEHVCTNSNETTNKHQLITVLPYIEKWFSSISFQHSSLVSALIEDSLCFVAAYSQQFFFSFFLTFRHFLLNFLRWAYIEKCKFFRVLSFCVYYYVFLLNSK